MPVCCTPYTAERTSINGTALKFPSQHLVFLEFGIIFDVISFFVFEAFFGVKQYCLKSAKTGNLGEIFKIIITTQSQRTNK